MHVWEQQLIQFEDEDARVLTLKSIMSETLFEEAGEFEDRSFGTSVDLRAVIIRYFCDKQNQ